MWKHSQPKAVPPQHIRIGKPTIGQALVDALGGSGLQQKLMFIFLNTHITFPRERGEEDAASHPNLHRPLPKAFGVYVPTCISWDHLLHKCPVLSSSQGLLLGEGRLRQRVTRRLRENRAM